MALPREGIRFRAAWIVPVLLVVLVVSCSRPPDPPVSIDVDVSEVVDVVLQRSFSQAIAGADVRSRDGDVIGSVADVLIGDDGMPYAIRYETVGIAAASLAVPLDEIEVLELDPEQTSVTINYSGRQIRLIERMGQLSAESFTYTDEALEATRLATITYYEDQSAALGRSLRTDEGDIRARHRAIPAIPPAARPRVSPELPPGISSAIVGGPAAVIVGHSAPDPMWEFRRFDPVSADHDEHPADEGWGLDTEITPRSHQPVTEASLLEPERELEIIRRAIERDVGRARAVVQVEQLMLRGDNYLVQLNVEHDSVVDPILGDIIGEAGNVESDHMIEIAPRAVAWLTGDHFEIEPASEVERTTYPRATWTWRVQPTAEGQRQFVIHLQHRVTRGGSEYLVDVRPFPQRVTVTTSWYEWGMNMVNSAEELFTAFHAMLIALGLVVVLLLGWLARMKGWLKRPKQDAASSAW